MNENDRIRFFEKTERRDSCLIWTGAIDTNGRGRFWMSRKLWAAPRIAWQIANGSEIPQGLCVCHTCDNPACVDIAHLFLGTQRENIQDMHRKGHAYKGGAHNPWNRNLTHCKRGHPLSGDNLMLSCGRRICRACARDAGARARARKRMAKESGNG